MDIAGFGQSSPRIIRLKDVMARTGMRRSWIYRECSANPSRFPKPIKIGPRASGWDAAAVDAWIAARLAGEPLEYDTASVGGGK